MKVHTVFTAKNNLITQIVAEGNPGVLTLLCPHIRFISQTLIKKLLQIVVQLFERAQP
jgi:hypothetical protein